MSKHHHFEEEQKPDMRNAGPEHMDGEQDLPAGNGTPDGADLERLCREQLCPACDVGKEAEETRLRALAEMDNFKKRMQRERDEQMRYAAESVLISCPRGITLILRSSTAVRWKPVKTCLWVWK